MGADGNRLEGGQVKGGSKDRRQSGKGGAEPELTGSDSEPEADTPGGTAGGTGEKASLGASGSSGAERSGAEWSGAERSGAKRSGAKRSGAKRSGAEWSWAED